MSTEICSATSSINSIFMLHSLLLMLLNFILPVLQTSILLFPQDSYIQYVKIHSVFPIQIYCYTIYLNLITTDFTTVPKICLHKMASLKAKALPTLSGVQGKPYTTATTVTWESRSTSCDFPPLCKKLRAYKYLTAMSSENLDHLQCHLPIHTLII